MSDVTDLIRALADLAWPAVLAFFLWKFRSELKGLIGRVEEANVAGSQFKFGQDLDRLNQSARDAVESLEAGPPEVVDAEVEGELDPAIRDALEASNPRAGLILLSAELERRVRVLAAQQGQLFSNPKVWRHRPVTESTLRLLELPPRVLAAVSEFRDVRNRIVHGHDATDAEVLRATDSAMTILEAIDLVPREINYVHASDVPLFADAEGQHERSDVKGVVLRTVRSDDPDDERLRVFPTTRTHFRPGEPVAWEWSHEGGWGESWYRNPDTGELDYAFTSSAEFIGTPLAEI